MPTGYRRPETAEGIGNAKEEIQRLQSIERKYKKILGLAADVAKTEE